MAVFKPMNRNSSSVTNRNTVNETNTNSMENTDSMNHCQCHEQEQNNYDSCGCGCPCPKPRDPVITISVDEGPTILEPDIIYGPPGKDGTINGYNKIEIEGGHNIDVSHSERMVDGAIKDILTIDTVTSEYDVDAVVQEDSNCDCDCDACVVHRQDRYSACWTIVHNLHKKPSVTVVDINDRVIECEVQYIGCDKVKLYFNQEFKGKAYLN